MEFSEANKPRIFICGSLPGINSTDSKIIEKTVRILEEQGVLVTNKAELTYPVNTAAERITLQRTQLASFTDADAGIGDITFRNPTTFGQLYTLNTFLNKPVGVTYNEGIKPSSFHLLRSHEMYSWEHAQDFNEIIRKFLIFVRTIRASKTLETQAEIKSLVKKQEEIGYIRTGNLTVDLQRKRLLFRDVHVDVEPIDYYFIEFWAKNMNEFTEREDAWEYCQKKRESKGSKRLVEEYARNAASVANKCDGKERKYAEQYKGRTRIIYFDPSSSPLPHIETFGSLQIDTTNAQAWINGKKLHLQETGRNFLTTLATHKDGITENELIYTFWKDKKNPRSYLHTVLTTLKRHIGDASVTPDGLLLRDPNSKIIRLKDSVEDA